MARHGVRNRIVAGGFLVLMAAAALGVLVLVGGWQTWFGETQRLVVRFPQAPNIKTGSPVWLLGQQVGQVVESRVVTPADHPELERHMVEVVAEIPGRFRIATDARVVILQSLVGQMALVNILSTGSGEPLPEGAVLRGRQQSPFADAAGELGIGETERTNIQEIIGNIRALSEAARQEVPDVLQKLRSVATNLVEGSEKVQGTLDRIDKLVDDNEEEVHQTLANARAITEDVKKQGETILAKINSASTRIDAILEENQPVVKETVAAARDVVADAKKHAAVILENVREATGDLKESLADFRRIAADAKSVVALNKRNVSLSVANFRATSEHLKALAQEVRRAPWRLFKSPDKAEVESLNLYDAARAFASAATDLDSISDTLQAMVEAQREGVRVEPETLQGMLDRLQETFDRYQQAETALFEEFERITP